MTKQVIPKAFTYTAWEDGTQRSIQEWVMVWNDEFDGTAGDAPDSSKWGREIGLIRNEEEQYYTNRTENARLSGSGSLLIEARKESYMGSAYTSASLTTQGKQTFGNGRIDFRAKMPLGRGVWPAGWLLGTVGTWPANGERDVVEYVGHQPTTAYCGNVHTTSGGNSLQSQSMAHPEDWHVYSTRRYDDRIEFWLDGELIVTYENAGTGTAQFPWTSDNPEFFILNLAIGGNWGGMFGIDDSIFDSSVIYEIDYVRAYERPT